MDLISCTIIQLGKIARAVPEKRDRIVEDVLRVFEGNDTDGFDSLMSCLETVSIEYFAYGITKGLTHGFPFNQEDFDRLFVILESVQPIQFRAQVHLDIIYHLSHIILNLNR